MQNYVTSPLLHNLIEGKPGHISWHIIMHWYQLTVEVYGASTGIVGWPISYAIGVLLPPGFKRDMGKTKALSVSGRGKLPFQ